MILEKIKNSTDLHQLSISDLKILAEEVRKRIIEVTAKNGGHLAPSLGATDLVIALLKVFDPFKDRFVWDVGHQSYAYKILTGRNNEFDTLRKFKGLSGFNNIFESKADAFGAGHASTSISAALGIQTAKDLKKEKDRVIAVIGDGALTGGMAFEALNHAGHIQKNLIVILNDNEMSISKNVGALQSYLTNMLVSKSYNTLKDKVWNISYNLPTNIRRKFITGVQKVEESLINILVPNIFFEDLGFKYVGPVEGHNIPRMVRIFNKVKNNIVGPVLIHTVTQKGKGCNFAENDATTFHGLGPYNENTGERAGKKAPTYSNVFGKKLTELAEKNDKITAITAAMTNGTGLTGFAKAHPERFFDVGIAEQHAVTFAGGLSAEGMKPFVAVYSTFLQRAYDQVIHDIALQKLPVVFCLDRAGLVGDDGATHHGVFDLSYLLPVPGMTIVAPSNGRQFEKILEFASEYDKGPLAIRYPRGEAHVIPESSEEIIYGKSDMLKEGEEIAILTAGKDLVTGMKIVEILEEKGLKPCLVDAVFVKPLDTEMLYKIKETCSIIVTVEDNVLKNGFGCQISEYFKNDGLTIMNFGLPDDFVTHGSVEELRNMLELRPEQIAEKILEKRG
ncbi:MAG: 1-deoxy-D-xylulose-5-phosphate synthase [Candidatus Cloacimonadota bacterium]|nr:MAG: 1-deoxy-D-xylulose-5-phosphate synthase [Candidatus Cloacimonadota bacterium]